MQRVLSFQMARGFGESSEFVTKRMCFSFLFSVGFLSLLCGFLLGRFAAEKTIAYRTEKKLLELSGNGLDSSDYLRHQLLQKLKVASFDFRFITNIETSVLENNDKYLINHVISNLSLVPHVVDHRSCITASIQGTRESDRYVIVSASNDGIEVVLELLKALSEIHEEDDWKPRRTLIFCMFSGKEDTCIQLFPSFFRSKIVAYMTLYGHSLKDGEEVNARGTEIALATVLEAVREIRSESNILSIDRAVDSNINISHVVFSFVGNSTRHKPYEDRKMASTTLAQIVSQAIWRFSESLVLKWDPNVFNQTEFNALDSFNSSEFWDAKEKAKNTLNQLVTSVEILNKRIDGTESTRTLVLRMFNDLLMELDKALVCSNNKIPLDISWEKLHSVQDELSVTSLSYLNKLNTCYETAINILYDWD